MEHSHSTNYTDDNTLYAFDVDHKGGKKQTDREY